MVALDAADFALGVVGAGAMGSGIAQVALTGGLSVRLVDADSAAVAKARDAIFQRLDRLVEKGEAAAAAMAVAKTKLHLAQGVAELAPCGVVIEAIVEEIEAKRRLFRELEAIVAPDAILASNTSSLPIAAIAQACRRRGRVAGMHFFNPVPLMRLVEIIAAAETEPAVTATLAALGQRLGRTPVQVKDAPGFLVNLGGRAFAQEALHILEENVATPDDVDAVMRECCGFRMGPFELMDLTGIDVNFPATRVIYEGYWQDPRLKSTSRHRSLFEAGRYGRKTGAGFHRYDSAGKKLAVPEAPPASAAKPARIMLAEADDRLVTLCLIAGVEPIGHDEGTHPILLAPLGDDCTTAATTGGFDPRRSVAIDVTHDTGKRVTIMAPPGADPAAGDGVAALLHAAGRQVTRIKDSPGFIAQRITAMIANLGCEMAQMGLASPADIDTAMRLGLNYPQGPLALAEKLGVKTTYDLLCRLQAITGSDRYRPSLWLRRRALLGLPAATPD